MTGTAGADLDGGDACVANVCGIVFGFQVTFDYGNTVLIPQCADGCLEP